MQLGNAHLFAILFLIHQRGSSSPTSSQSPGQDCCFFSVEAELALVLALKQAFSPNKKQVTGHVYP